jgi:hypothetical protein
VEVWPALPQSLEEEMAVEEADRSHIPQARAVLERALITQFQCIAEGLLANRILNRHEVNELTWVAQYLSRHDPDEAERWRVREPEAKAESGGEGGLASALRQMAVAFRAEHPPAIGEYKRTFYLRVSRREVRRVSPDELAKLSVRIYGGRVPVWQEGRINGQLARLGSDLRLFIASADILRTADLMAKLGVPPKEPPNLAVFLLGVARPCTSAFKVQLFEFDHEYAVSPYIHSSSPGLVDQCRIVLRHKFWHGTVMNYPANSVIVEGLAQPILDHELWHIVQRYGFVVPGHFAAWRPVMRNDICRFAREPKMRGEIYKAFYKTFDQFEMNPQLALGLLPPDEPKDKLRLADLLDELLADGLLEWTKDEKDGSRRGSGWKLVGVVSGWLNPRDSSVEAKIVCHLYDDGRAWSIE